MEGDEDKVVGVVGLVRVVQPSEDVGGVKVMNAVLGQVGLQVEGQHVGAEGGQALMGVGLVDGEGVAVLVQHLVVPLEGGEVAVRHLKSGVLAGVSAPGRRQGCGPGLGQRACRRLGE